MEDTIMEVRTVQNIIKNQLIGVEVPANTRTWKPVAHKQLMDITMESLDICGFKLTNEIYTLGRDGLQANGKYHLEYGNDNDMGLMIAWQNSYDKSLSLKFAVGGHIFICANGVVRGDIGTYKSKHIGEIQQITPQLLREYICRAGDTFEDMIREKERMKEIEVTKRTTAELIGRLYIEDAIITSTQMNIIKGELRKPTHDYGAPGSLYELYNYGTYALKSATPHTWMKQQMDMHRFITAEYDLA